MIRQRSRGVPGGMRMTPPHQIEMPPRGGISIDVMPSTRMRSHRRHRLHRRREFLHLFGEQRAVGLLDDLGESEVAHLEVGETVQAVPLELGLGANGDYGVADRE